MRRDDALLLDMLLACRKLVRFTHSLTAATFQQNELARAYFDIRIDAVWDTVQNDIPQLLATLESVLPPTAEGQKG